MKCSSFVMTLICAKIIYVIDEITTCQEGQIIVNPILLRLKPTICGFLLNRYGPDWIMSSTSIYESFATRYASYTAQVQNKTLQIAMIS